MIFSQTCGDIICFLFFIFLKDISNFDPDFTSEEPLDSVVEDSQLSQTVQEQFAGTHLLVMLYSFLY